MMVTSFHIFEFRVLFLFDASFWDYKILGEILNFSLHKIEFKDAMVCELPRKLFDILLPSRNENTDDAI